ncbi:hypothetical protein H9P43_005206 [Blastocladiella emersonii ATCC 22665]|nr:hypothetical protein H9P43_005206 [Blastocladiella emersonii ATCC 22665]
MQQLYPPPRVQPFTARPSRSLDSLASPPQSGDHSRTSTVRSLAQDSCVWQRGEDVIEIDLSHCSSSCESEFYHLAGSLSVKPLVRHRTISSETFSSSSSSSFIPPPPAADERHAQLGRQLAFYASILLLVAATVLVNLVLYDVRGLRSLLFPSSPSSRDRFSLTPPLTGPPFLGIALNWSAADTPLAFAKRTRLRPAAFVYPLALDAATGVGQRESDDLRSAVARVAQVGAALVLAVQPSPPNVTATAAVWDQVGRLAREINRAGVPVLLVPLAPVAATAEFRRCVEAVRRYTSPPDAAVAWSITNGEYPGDVWADWVAVPGDAPDLDALLASVPNGKPVMLLGNAGAAWQRGFNATLIAAYPAVRLVAWHDDAGTDEFVAGAAVRDLPPVTRSWAGLTLLTSVLTHIRVVSSFSLYFDWAAITRRKEYWRLFASFFYYGNLSFDTVFHLYVIGKYSKMLEETSYRNRPADFLYFLLLASLASLLAAWSLPPYTLPILSAPVTSALTYVWARRNPWMYVSLLGIADFRAPYLPWVLLAFSAVMHGRVPVGDLVGIAVGHVYWYLEDILPRMRDARGRVRGKVLVTPRFLQILLGQRPADMPDVALAPEQPRAAHAPAAAAPPAAARDPEAEPLLNAEDTGDDAGGLRQRRPAHDQQQ